MSDISVSATQPGSGPGDPDPTRDPTRDPTWADWITVWQSELAALAVDREAQEAAQRAVDLWAAAALAAGHDPAGRAGPAAPPRPASAPAAPRRRTRRRTSGGTGGRAAADPA